MDKGSEDFVLNWGEDLLYGWHNDTNFNAIAGFVMALERGYKMPAVDIIKRGHAYYLCVEIKSNLFRYGGHHRSIAHYIMDKSLKCNLWKNDEDEHFEKRKFSKIEDSVLLLEKTMDYTWYDMLKEKDAREIAVELGDKLSPYQRFLDVAR